MTEWLVSVGSLTGAVVVGVLILVLGEWAKVFLVEPMQRFAEVVGRVALYHLLYANLVPMPGLADPDSLKAGSATLRQAAADLQEAWYRLRWRWLATRVFGLPRDGAVRDATKGLVGWSNSLFDIHADRQVHRERIRTALHLPLLD